MTDSVLAPIAAVFSTRLQTLSRLLVLAETQWRGKRVDPNSLLAARLAVDMLPLPHQIVFACKHANEFAAWATGGVAAENDPTQLDFGQLKQLVELTIRRLKVVTAKADPTVLERDKRVELLEGLHMNLPGRAFVDDWLMPNFYFHLVTAYDILRHSGVMIGKADYLAHLAGHIRANSKSSQG
jgi:hypothetical protein